MSSLCQLQVQLWLHAMAKGGDNARLTTFFIH
jgi:hypothetical protein